MNKITEMELHDCTLKDIKFAWNEKCVTLIIQNYSIENQQLFLQNIKLCGVSEIFIPRKDEWGPSSSIHEVVYENGSYLIQMQSGDLIRITCDQVAEIVCENPIN